MSPTPIFVSLWVIFTAFVLALLSGCSQLPSVMQTIDDVEDSAIKIEVDKEAVKEIDDLSMWVTLKRWHKD